VSFELHFSLDVESTTAMAATARSSTTTQSLTWMCGGKAVLTLYNYYSLWRGVEHKTSRLCHYYLGPSRVLWLLVFPFGKKKWCLLQKKKKNMNPCCFFNAKRCVVNKKRKKERTTL
jgi:hypothetical protein